MTVQELINILMKYDRNLTVTIVDEYGNPYQVSYCSPQTLDESGERFLTMNEDKNNECEEVVSIWPEC